MKIVTSMTILTTAEGKRLSLTFSDINESGKIVKENERMNRVVVDENALRVIAELEDFAQRIVERM